MSNSIRLVGAAIAGLVALWVLLELVGIVLGIVSWVVSTVVSLAVLAVLLYVGYLALSTLGSRSGGLT